MWFYGCGPGPRAWAGRGWGWHEDTKSGAFWFGRGSRGGPWRGGRMFEQGDLKFVILQLLEDKPRHGYEIIKELEERSGGRYAPSPGTVYPTLTMLEEMGYATATAEEGGKRVYAITDAGRAYLQENRTTVDDVVDRLSEMGASIFGEHMRPAHEAFGRLGRAYAQAIFRQTSNAARVAKVVEILNTAAKSLRDLAESP